MLPISASPDVPAIYAENVRLLPTLMLPEYRPFGVPSEACGILDSGGGEGRIRIGATAFARLPMLQIGRIICPPRLRRVTKADLKSNSNPTQAQLKLTPMML